MAMPTDVHFIGVGSIQLEEEFDKVNTQLHANDAQFNRLNAGERSRVTIYKSSVAYIEEASEEPGGALVVD
jgi:hypothetical protein